MITIGPLLIPEENKLLQIQNVQMKINQTYLNTPGVLIITEKYVCKCKQQILNVVLRNVILIFNYFSVLCWKQNDRQDSVSIQWSDITVHAVSLVPSKCIYIMMDLNLEWPGVYGNGVPAENAPLNDMDVSNGHSDNDDSNDSDDNDDNVDDDVDEGHFEGITFI